MLGAHSTRTTEQSAALVAYWAAATANTMGVYALAAWGGRARTSAYDGARLTRWYADVGVYLLATLLWEALAPPAGAFWSAETGRSSKRFSRVTDSRSVRRRPKNARTRSSSRRASAPKRHRTSAPAGGASASHSSVASR